MIQKLKLVLAIIFPALLLGFLSGCYYDVEEELYPVDPSGCDTVSVSFNSDVKPLFDGQCVTCHSDGLMNGSLSVESYASVKTYLDQTGKKEAMIRAISWPADLTPALRMPQGQPKLPDCSVSKITAWINAGYPEN